MSVKFECSSILSQLDEGRFFLCLHTEKCVKVCSVHTVNRTVCQETVKDTSYAVKHTQVITKKKMQETSRFTTANSLKV
jgi:hypothetical protein